MRLPLALLTALLGCKAHDKIDPLPRDETAEENYYGAYTRLLEFREGGWIVSRRPDGRPQHVGDSLLWTGLAMAAVPCDAGDELERHLIEVIHRLDGGLVRYEPLGEYAGGREASLDGALGLYRGAAERIVACGRGEAWGEALRTHLSFLERSGGRLHLGTTATLELFSALPEVVCHRSGDSRCHDTGIRNRRAMERAVGAWAWAVNAAKAAAFRVHLGWLVLTTLERTGHDINPDNRNAYCAATRGMGIAIVDHWCGRDGLKAWLDAFEFDRWEYAFQRAPAWESPDGDGDETPGLDYVLAIKEAYGF